MGRHVNAKNTYSIHVCVRVCTYVHEKRRHLPPGDDFFFLAQPSIVRPPAAI